MRTAGQSCAEVNTPCTALLIGPTFPTGQKGGLELALGDIAQQLRLRGWQINEVVSTTASTTLAANVLKPTVINTGVAPLERWLGLRQLWQRLPLPFRRLLRTFILLRGFSANASHNLYGIEELLTQHSGIDLVLLCVDGSPPGAVALALDLHKHVALISLHGLVEELTRQRGIRGLASMAARKPLHPYLFRRVDPVKVKLAIFASEAWQAEATQAGLPGVVAHTIYFGVPIPKVQLHLHAAGSRLLWVGRLSPEKGLHIVLQALPHIRSQIPDATLTVVAADWSAAYRKLILSQIERYKLQAVVRFRLAMPRKDLQAIYAEHDILLFHSVFAEPVAFVLMEAMAAGLPVVSSLPRAESALIQDNVTCVCYNPRNVPSLVDAVLKLHADTPLQRRLAVRARQVVREHYSVEAMGQAYDAVLSEYVNKQR